jgi:general secretion pathway protein J
MTARARSAGFTLLELMIALAIVGALLAIAFGGLRVAIAAWTQGEDRAEFHQHARGITQIVGRAVAGAYPYRGALGETPERRLLFEGKEDRLEFVTRAAPFPTGIPVAFTAIVIAVEDDAREGRALVVRQRALPNWEPFTKAVVVLRDPAIQGLELRYLGTDGSWTDSWDADGEQSLPAGVRVRLVTSQRGRLAPLPAITVSLRALTSP